MQSRMHLACLLCFLLCFVSPSLQCCYKESVWSLACISLLCVVSSSLQYYPSQTKILEGRTNISECVFEALFKGLSTRFGQRIVEECFENGFWKVVSSFQNRRLGSINIATKKTSDDHLNPKISAFAVITVPYLHFSYHFFPRREMFWIVSTINGPGGLLII